MIASGPEQLPRRGGGGVVLADVDPVGVAGAGQLRVVVDDEEGAVGVAEPAEGERGELDLTPRQALLAQLDDVGAAVERGAEQRLGVGAVGPGVADEVEPRRAQPLAPQRVRPPLIEPGSSSGLWLPGDRGG